MTKVFTNNIVFVLVKDETHYNGDISIVAVYTSLNKAMTACQKAAQDAKDDNEITSNPIPKFWIEDASLFGE